MSLRNRIEAMQHIAKQYPTLIEAHSKPDDIVQMVLLLEEMHFHLKDRCPPELAELKMELSRLFKGQYTRSGIYVE